MYMKFVWDEDKAAENIRKHGVSFDDATAVFFDPNAIVVPDPYPDEERWNVIGVVNKVLFVVYTEPDAETTRLISARRAVKGEIDGYKNGVFRRGEGNGSRRKKKGG